MTAKRFMLDDCGELIDLNNHKFIDYGEECCNLLNEQHETIQRLKMETEELNEDAMSYQTLYEQQKQTIQRLKQNIDELLSVNVEEELLKENKRLRKAVDNCQFRTLDLLDYIKEKETVTHQEIKDWWNSKVME